MNVAIANRSVLILNAPRMMPVSKSKFRKTKIIHKDYLGRDDVLKTLDGLNLIIAHHQPLRFDALRIADAARANFAVLPVVITGAGNALQTPAEEKVRGAMILRGPMRVNYLDELINYAQAQVAEPAGAAQQTFDTATAHIAPEGVEFSRIEFPESIDSRNVARIRQTIFMQMAMNGGLRPRLILDFKAVRWIDSEGVRLLEDLTREFRGRGYKSVQAAGASPVIYCSMQNTVLARLFDSGPRTHASEAG